MVGRRLECACSVPALSLTQIVFLSSKNWKSVCGGQCWYCSRPPQINECMGNPETIARLEITHSYLYLYHKKTIVHEGELFLSKAPYPPCRQLYCMLHYLQHFVVVWICWSMRHYKVWNPTTIRLKSRLWKLSWLKTLALTPLLYDFLMSSHQSHDFSDVISSTATTTCCFSRCDFYFYECILSLLTFFKVAVAHAFFSSIIRLNHFPWIQSFGPWTDEWVETVLSQRLGKDSI